MYKRFFEAVVTGVTFGLIAALLLLPLLARAEDYAVVTLRSYHFDRSAGYNEQNFGLGYEHTNGNFSLATGFYKNSLERETVYGLVGYTPWRIYDWRLGIAGGLATGYNCGYSVCVAAMGLATRDWDRFGVNVALAPIGVAVQAKWKF